MCIKNVKFIFNKYQFMGILTNGHQSRGCFTYPDSQWAVENEIINIGTNSKKFMLLFSLNIIIFSIYL